MRFRYPCLAIVSTVAVFACTPQDRPAGPAGDAAADTATLFDAAAAAAAAGISAQAMRETVTEIAGDAYGGRGRGTAGDRMTQGYLSAQLEAAGLETTLQPFELVSITSSQPDEWSFAGEQAALTLRQHDEFIVGSGRQTQRSTVTDAQLVFVGYGIEAPEYEWNDYKDQDLSGKVLVMLNNDPDWDDELFAGKRRLYYGRWTYKYESAARQGAAGAIIIHTTPSAGYGWQVIQSSWTGPQFELPARDDETRLQFAAWVTDTAATRLFEAAGLDLDELRTAARARDFEPVPLGLTTSIAFENDLEKTSSANVIGVLEGSDPVLKNEYIVYTAHHDHLGTDPRLDDPIYNGARDNATGCAMILEVARAFRALPSPPRRSIMIAFVGAEEQGLLGSRHFAANPPVAPGRLAANVNLDSGNIWGVTRDITFIGKGKSSLDEVADTIAAHFDRVVKPDQFADRGLFYRSDQFNLARIGVPAPYLKGGTDFIGREPGWGVEKINAYTADHYHQPSDELTADWRFDGLVDDARFAFWAGYLTANADRMPTWNPGDEFEAARERALAELQD